MRLSLAVVDTEAWAAADTAMGQLAVAMRAAVSAVGTRASTLQRVSAARAAAMEMMPGYAVPSGSVDMGQLLAVLADTLPEPLAAQVRTTTTTTHATVGPRCRRERRSSANRSHPKCQLDVSWVSTRPPCAASGCDGARRCAGSQG